MPGKYLYAAVMAVMLAAWFSENAVAPKAQPAPEPTAVLNDPATLQLDLKGATADGQCNLEFINQTLLDATPLRLQKGQPLSLRGWAMDSSYIRLPRRLTVRFTNAEGTDFFAATQLGLPRADVQMHFKVPDALLMSGFQAVVDAPGLPVGQYRLTLVMLFDDATYICDNGRQISIQ